MILRLLIELLFKARDARQVLLFLEEDTITLQVCIFDTLLALYSELLDRFLLLLIQGNTLLLIFKQ